MLFLPQVIAIISWETWLCQRRGVQDGLSVVLPLALLLALPTAVGFFRGFLLVCFWVFLFYVANLQSGLQNFPGRGRASALSRWRGAQSRASSAGPAAALPGEPGPAPRLGLPVRACGWANVQAWGSPRLSLPIDALVFHIAPGPDSLYAYLCARRN